MVDLTQLRRCTRDELEALYLEARAVEVPTGSFRGVHLLRVDEPGQRRPLYAVSLGFAFVPFGIDFDTRCWSFLHPGLQVGRFTPLVGRSRWRETTVVGLHYHVSRLPGVVRRILYDEVKPLSADLGLGLGGVAGERGHGDHFFFALERRR